MRLRRPLNLLLLTLALVAATAFAVFGIPASQFNWRTVAQVYPQPGGLTDVTIFLDGTAPSCPTFVKIFSSGNATFTFGTSTINLRPADVRRDLLATNIGVGGDIFALPEADRRIVLNTTDLGSAPCIWESFEVYVVQGERAGTLLFEVQLFQRGQTTPVDSRLEFAVQTDGTSEWVYTAPQFAG